jgi:hypothetical protein
MTDPPLISLVAMRIAARRGANLINWLQDIYPEVAVALNVPFIKGPILRTIAQLRDRSLKTAAANVVVGNLMADKIVARGIARDHIHVIANWRRRRDRSHRWARQFIAPAMGAHE